MVNKIIVIITTICVSISAHAVHLISLLPSEKAGFMAQLPEADLTLVSRAKDLKGNVHTRYVQTYEGLPVFGYQVIEHEYVPSLQRSIFPLPAWTGVWVDGIETDLKKSLRSMDPAAILMSVKNSFALQHNSSLILKNEFAEPVIYIDQNNIAHRAVSIHFFADLPEGNAPTRPHYIVDSVTGEVLEHWEGLTSEQVGTGPGGNGKTGEYQYGLDYPALDILVVANTCVMQSEDVAAVNMANFTSDGLIYTYTCDPAAQQYEQSNDAINGAYSPLNDAYSFAHTVVKMYEDWYGHQPFVLPLDVRVHYGDNYANAFWNGESMTFGDGNDELYPLTTLDVVSHELAHGVTEYASQLIYSNQSGGLNESFSDIAAKAAEFYFYGAPLGWTIGADIFKAPGAVLRYMDYPSKDGRSIDTVAGFTFRMDPHQSSGVFNRVFYLLATTPGWDVRTAFDVMYTANMYYWYAWSNFESAGYDTVIAAAFLGYPYEDVMAALSAVGIFCTQTACED
jgi:Zn-dependent metalloprotease